MGMNKHIADSFRKLSHELALNKDRNFAAELRTALGRVANELDPQEEEMPELEEPADIDISTK